MITFLLGLLLGWFKDHLLKMIKDLAGALRKRMWLRLTLLFLVPVIALILGIAKMYVGDGEGMWRVLLDWPLTSLLLACFVLFAGAAAPSAWLASNDADQNFVSISTPGADGKYFVFSLSYQTTGDIKAVIPYHVAEQICKKLANQILAAKAADVLTGRETGAQQSRSFNPRGSPLET